MAHKYGLNTNYIDLITFLEIIYEDIPINKIPYTLSSTNETGCATSQK